MLKVIITGANGFVGQGALIECLKSPKVEKVLSVTRRSLNRQHDKLTELIIPDFKEFKENDERLKDYNTCIYCATKTSNGIPEDEYRNFTHDIPIHFAKSLGINKDMTFIYISGAGANINSRLMWARVKAETENDLLKMKGKEFKDVYCVRPSIMKHSNEQQNVSGMQKFYSACYWIGRPFGGANLIEEVGKTFIQLSLNGYEKEILESNDIKICSDKYDDLINKE
ncbi:hypothetical protein BCR32DRAFT_271641 [Anaeromyces robustus]|uniref:NAD-dependent epimerase/dehydratase domain-containing protein n=1 Tax=Anaeromyces robustus TaxID=1754192 RepID=A0A1Y1WRC9_9FUNG|nr:hypothetical protein BCR32DRAFT_271641 [Anaeromyces robustus]|eukprot:ORX75838.1 hypothetical protein BCR32DRAFT_271641 [Anaeromyces robustus]